MAGVRESDKCVNMLVQLQAHKQRTVQYGQSLVHLVQGALQAKAY